MEGSDLNAEMAGIDDVAREAGVSAATVSRAFNRPDLLSPATRERVRAVAQSLNYQANHSARNLRGGGRNSSGKNLTHNIGYLADRKSVMHGDPFAYELLEAVEAALCGRGLGIRVIPASPEGGIPREIADGEVDGVICRFSSPMVRQIAGAVHTVTLDAFDAEAGGYAVIPDYAGGLRMVMERLLAAGLTDIALLASDPHAPAVENFWSLFPNIGQETLQRNGLPVTPRLFRGAAFDPRSGYEAGRRIFGDPAGWPQAIVGPDGAMLGLYRAAAEFGVRIPDDVSVIGVNGLKHGEYLHPALTTLDVQPARLGAAAVEILADCIARGTPRRGMEIIPVILRERASARI